MKTLIVFREGQSGNFLRNVINNVPLDRVSFRTDEVLLNAIFFTHKADYVKQSKNFDLVLRILPEKQIYNAIYNNFMKKLLVEDMPDFKLTDWVQDTNNWYDRCYYNIKEYWELITYDIRTNTYPNVINFDRLLDTDYVASVLKQYYGLGLDADRRDIIDKYRELQLGIGLHTDAKNMIDIVNPVEHLLATNPWFFSYCVFAYEINNNLTEADRLWSVDNLKGVQTRQNLLEIAEQYKEII
jgi:hypothetical protein